MGNLKQDLADHLDAEFDVDLDEQEAIATELELAEDAGDTERVEELRGGLWSIDSDPKAEWALRMLGRHEAEVASAAEVAARLIERTRKWLEAEQLRHAPHVEFFERQLRVYHERKLEADPKAKTIRLPSGTLASRRNTVGKVTVEDPEAFLAWWDSPANAELREAVPELVVAKRTPSVAVIKEAFTPKGEGMVDDGTGEIVPGVVHTPPETSFTPKPDPLL